MSKQLYNQRYILKIPSIKLKKNNWNLNISLEQAKKNKELVKLSDGQALRFIREITGKDYSEEEINSVKREIKELKKEKNSISNIKKIKELNIKLDSMLYITDYVSIVFSKKSELDKACSKKGVTINGKKYKRIIGTTNGLKKNQVNFCSEEIYPELNKRLENDRDKNLLCIPGKFEAYKSLSASYSSPVTNTKRVLVIKDAEVTVEGKVIKVFDDGEGKFKIDKNIPYKTKKEPCDGCGMIRPSLAKQWAIDLGLYKIVKGKKVATYIPSGFNTRWAYTKGMVFTYDFELFAKKVAKNFKVKDVWGEEHDIRNIDIVLTTNMLKLWYGYSSIGDYIAKCDKNGFMLGVSKVCPPKLEEKRNLNYQYLQSYELSEEDIEDLTSETVNNIKDCLGGNPNKAILFTKGGNITPNSIQKSENDFIKALMIDNKVIGDFYIKSRIYRMLEKKIKQAKIGVIQVDGNYSIVSGDLYGLCQSMFGLEITGLLKKNQFYSKTWSDKGENEIISFRSPMTSHNNIKRMPLVNNPEVNYWFKYMNTVTVINMWDFTTDAMNGMDYDSDAIISTNNRIIKKRTRDELPIICEQNNMPKEKITQAKLKKSNKNGFCSEIGSITNRVTAMYDVLAGLEKDSEEYNTLMDRIICGQAYQQEEIDKIKGIQAKVMPKEWYNYKYNKINTDENGEIIDSKEVVAEKEKNIKIMVNKKPYFFIYNYDNLRAKYNTFVKEVENNCLIKFGKTLKELKENAETLEEKQFLLSILYKSPVFNNPCTMNKICWKIEEEFKDVKLKVKQDDKNFNYQVYKTNRKYKKDTYEKINKIYKDYNKSKREGVINVNNTMTGGLEGKDNMNIANSKQVFIEYFRTQASEICPNEEELTNIVIDLCYKNKNNRQFAWDLCGEQIIKNLLKNNNNTYTYPIKDNQGEIEWNGEKYSLTKLKMEEEQCEV